MSEELSPFLTLFAADWKCQGKLYLQGSLADDPQEKLPSRRLEWWLEKTFHTDPQYNDDQKFLDNVARFAATGYGIRNEAWAREAALTYNCKSGNVLHLPQSNDHWL